MKTSKFLWATLWGTLFIFLACNNNSSTNAASDQVDQNDEANEIITFNNTLVKADNSHASFINTFISYVDRVDKFIAEQIANPSAQIVAPISVPAVSINNLKGVVYPGGWEKEYQPLVEEMENSFKALKTLQKEIETYRSAEDWKEDSGSKMVDFKENAMKEIDKNREASATLFEKMRPEVNQAEEAILGDHPLKDQILQSKTIMELTQQLNNDAYSMTEPTDLKSNFDQQYTELEELFMKNKDLDLPEDYKSKSRSFTAFNDAVNDFLGKMRIIKRELNAGALPSEDNLRSFDTATQNVLRTYNSFVD